MLKAALKLYLCLFPRSDALNKVQAKKIFPVKKFCICDYSSNSHHIMSYFSNDFADFTMLVKENLILKNSGMPNSVDLISSEMENHLRSAFCMTFRGKIVFMLLIIFY